MLFRSQPHFRYTGVDPSVHVWNLGWPLATMIWDHRSGLHVGPFAYLLIPGLFVVGLTVFAFAWFLAWRRANHVGFIAMSPTVGSHWSELAYRLLASAGVGFTATLFCGLFVVPDRFDAVSSRYYHLPIFGLIAAYLFFRIRRTDFALGAVMLATVAYLAIFEFLLRAWFNTR